MKLLLTSQGTTNIKVMNKLIKLCGKNPRKTKLLFITTAAKPIENPNYMYKERERLKDTGFIVKEYDLDGKSTYEVKNEVDESDVIFAIGGEPFYLLKAARKSGFDKIIKNLGDEKLYVGASAGTYIACPSVEMGLWKKPKRNIYGLKNLSGMGLVDFLVFAHHEKKWDKLINKKAKKINYKIYPLTDKQAINVNNGKLEIVNP
jgi:dipeptidase E